MAAVRLTSIGQRQPAAGVWAEAARVCPTHCGQVASPRGVNGHSQASVKTVPGLGVGVREALQGLRDKCPSSPHVPFGLGGMGWKRG